MATIQLNKQVYQFLNSAIDEKSIQKYLRYFLVTDQEKLITTDGYRMHVWSVDKQYEPGYYSGDKEGTLNRVDDAAVDKKELYLIKNLYYPQILGGAQDKPTRMIYEGWNDSLRPIDMKHWPKISKTGFDMRFKNGLVGGEERAICLGINSLSLHWLEDQEISSTDVEKTILLDAKYALEALSSPLIQPVMRWTKRAKAAIIGDIESAHAVIMPVLERR